MVNASADAARVIELIDGALDDWDIGPDAMRWQPAAPAQAAPPARVLIADIRVGDLVDYHGSITHAHDRYVVTATERGRLTLHHHLYPEDRLSQVRPVSVTQTGEWVPVCRCGHPHTHPITAPNGKCPRYGCECPHHPTA